MSEKAATNQAHFEIFEENRAKWTDAQLAPYLGQWVFFSLDGSRILASHNDLGKAYTLLDQAGFLPDDTVLDHLVDGFDIELGGAQLW